MGRPFDFSRSVQNQARLRQNGVCAHCGSSLDDLEEHGHHVIANQAGNPGDPSHQWLRSVDNCVVVCDTCHGAVHDDSNYQTGATAPPNYYRYSHGANGGAQHDAWASGLEERAAALYNGRGGGTPGRGAAWGGPGGTPGFEPSGINGVASALELFQHWASQLSMINAAFDAWNEILERKNEIVQAQNDNPIFPVYIRIYWKIDFDNNPNMPKIYHYLGADIQSGAAGMPASLYDGWQHSYLMVIPALKKDDNKKGSGGPVTWRDGYRSVLGLLQGDHTTGGDPVAALRVLNGSPMYDILPILQTLKASDPRLFDKLQQALAWPSANVGVDRLRAAFFAVQMSENSGNDAFGCYKSACNEFAALPQDQQKDIENFLSGKSGEERKVLTSPAGEWNVRVGKWLWVYSFDTKGAVTWRDPFNGENGKGKWKQIGGKIMIDWSPSQSKDTWYLPLDAAKQKGMAFVDGEGSFPVAATKN